MDDDDIGSDEMVGTMTFSTKELLKDALEDTSGKTNASLNKYVWKNVYGSPLGKKGSTASQMNTHPEYASHWKGRVLF
jgi:hypothetical protein